MQVIRIAGKLFPPYYGGLPIHAKELSEGLSKYQVHSQIYTTNGVNFPKREEKKDITIQRFHSIVEPMDNPLSPGIFINLLQTRPNADLLHVHSHLYLTSFWGYLYSKIRSTPLIVTDHGFFADKDTITNAFQRVYLRAISKKLLCHAAAVICYTPYEKSLLLELGISENRIVIIPNGTDLAKLNSVGTFQRETRVIFWAGRFSKEKGLPYLFYAVNLLLQAFPELQVRLAGSGDQEAHLRKLAHELKITSAIKFLGRLSPKQIHEEMRKATIFVLPSMTEGFPRTIVESFALGLPVVTSDLPAYDHIPSSCILRYPRSNIQALSHCIENLLRNPDIREKMSYHANQYAKDWFDWNKIVFRTYQLYQYVIQGGTKPSSLSMLK